MLLQVERRSKRGQMIWTGGRRASFTRSTPDHSRIPTTMELEICEVGFVNKWIFRDKQIWPARFDKIAHREKYEC